MARDGDRITAGDGEADLDFFGTTIKVRNPALAKLLSGGAVDPHQRPSVGCNIKWKR